LREAGIDPSAMRLDVGSEYVGTITGVERYGLFVSVHGIIGLIRRNNIPSHIRDWQNESKGSLVRVRVVSITGHRLDLAYANGEEAGAGGALSPSQYEIGVEYEGIVTGVKAYGVFVRLDGCDGLIRRNRLPDAARIYEDYPEGSSIRVRVHEITDKGLELEHADYSPPPEGGFPAPAIGDEYDGIVTGALEYGLFVMVGAQKGL